ncbi:MAG: DUF2846 domain-containing protein [Verrucomicrobia bacterium]|nr:DUF2846 domain-containing protein [Verrucomicrobiota bacterium]
MKNLSRLLITALLLALATGCASTKQFVPMPNQNKQVDADKVRIYVVRPTTIGAAVSMKVVDSGQFIGQTGPKSYLCWDRDPGMTVISSKAENKAKVSLEAEAGKVYYIQQHVRMGLLYARNKLTFLNDAEGRKIVSKCSPPK